MRLVCAITTATVAPPKGGGHNIVVREGGYWRAEDPVVVAYPSLFTEDVRYNLNSSEPLDAPVEQASAAPGEKRGPVNRKTN